MYPNRTLCQVLNEMRDCLKTNNFSYLLGLIEEVQSLGNRMEASLTDKNDLYYDRKELRKLKKEIKRLKEEKEKLNG